MSLLRNPEQSPDPYGMANLVPLATYVDESSWLYLLCNSGLQKIKIFQLEMVTTVIHGSKTDYENAS